MSVRDTLEADLRSAIRAQSVVARDTLRMVLATLKNRRIELGREPDEGEVLHSFHAYFLRPGDPSIPILYTVDRTKDGRAFATRRIVAVQRGNAIFHMEASFHRPERGLEHQDEMPEVRAPEALPTMEERLAPLISIAGSRKMGMHMGKPFNKEDVVYLTELLESGQIAPVIDRTYPLNEVPEALHYQQEGSPRGKVVIIV